jgi:hypothetical protein
MSTGSASRLFYQASNQWPKKFSGKKVGFCFCVKGFIQAYQVFIGKIAAPRWIGIRILRDKQAFLN